MTLSFQTPSNVRPPNATLREKAIHLDLLGVATAIAAIAAFVLSMHYVGTNQGWSSRAAWAYMVAFVILTAVFIINEFKMKSKAILQFHFLKRRRFSENCVYIFFLAGLFFPLLFSLPIRFQSINNESASNSGLRLIPLVLGVSIFTMITNYVLTHWPRYTTLLVLGAVFGIAGAALISSASQTTSATTWIVYELVTAAGVGFALQIPMIANQASVAASEIPAATSNTLFFETLGQALFTAAGEAAFINRLIINLSRFPSSAINSDVVIAAGATGFRKLFNADQVRLIEFCYDEALKVTHTMSLGCGVAAGLVWLSMVAPTVRRRLSRNARDQ